MKILIFIGTIIFFVNTISVAQENPVYVKTPAYFSKTPPLRELKPILPSEHTDDQDEVYEITKEPFFEKHTDVRENLIDQVIQNYMGARSLNGICVNVEGMSNLQNKIPPDTEGDIGSDYYVQMINMILAVFDKEGQMVYGPVADQ